MAPASNPALMPHIEDRASRGQKTRDRLLSVATDVFANKGFQTATTREICDLAESNMAAIHYHFGDKAGLYKAVLALPIQGFISMSEGFNQASGDFQSRMLALYGGLLEPLRSQDPMFAQHMRLHFREMLEPTGAIEELLQVAFHPFFTQVAIAVSQEMGQTEVDDDAYRLTFAMVGMAMDFYTSQQCSSVLAPNLTSTPEQVGVLIDRLAGYATGMLEFERKRLSIQKKEGS
jgi:TetR/AcrR family transcriptional regulator, regulator of cefoperazone and chloramphenicol sensitivity